MSAGYVVMRSTGEYSDRDEIPIRFVETEELAQALVAQADRERQECSPVPEQAWVPPPHRGYFPSLTAEQALENRQFWEKRSDERDAELLALGFVDPYGPQPEATYSYTAVHAYVPR